MATTFLTRSLLLLSTIQLLCACETTAPPSGGDSEAGEEIAGEQAAGEIMGGASDSGGEMMAGEAVAGEETAGEMNAGEQMAGFDIIAAGSDNGNEPDRPTFDPSTPLPEPMATTLMPPEAIAEPGEAEVDASCEGNYFNEVRGWVVDELGEPMVGAKVQLCVRDYATATLACLSPQTTRAGGYFKVPVTASTRCMLSATLRAIVPRVAFAPMYCHGSFENDSGDGVLRLTDPIVLYQTRPAENVNADGNESSEASLIFNDDLQMTLNVESLYGPTVDELGGRSVSPDAPGLCFLKHSESAPQIDGVYAFAPEGDFTNDSAKVSFPNTMGYAPGEEIQLYVLGNLDCSIEGMSESLEEGDWVPVTTATVDMGGARIETADGAGIPCLSWLGYGPVAE